MLGVCYYPEHWPECLWAEDARRMVEMGISWVRIGEFAWSRIEPARGDWRFEWLDRAIATLGAAGLKVVMCTPTATPPKWLIDERPDILAFDEFERPRRFGSRRHYDFASPAWLEETRRIVEAVGRRYGRNDAVQAWQLDNEYGCHDTVVSYAPACQTGFRQWLEHRYASIDKLNEAWGTAFWSQEYASFGQIDPPNMTVTEAHPGHRLDYWRFASDQVANYNILQAEILRELSPGRPVTHNFMGFFTEFDHRAVARQLDFPSWDSYPLGFTDARMTWLSDEERARYARTGHPDVAAFHHDLYRGLSGDHGFWVMEQQPGPVNWAPHNPAPLPGMVRLWTLEALAHGAAVVSYFRWRQARHAQEQFHSGLLRPDNTMDKGGDEAAVVAGELSALSLANQRSLRAPVAMLFDEASDQALRIQPQGQSFNYFRLVFTFYEALRRLGLDIDIVRPGDPVEAYDLLIVPTLPIVDDEAAKALLARQGPTIIGPRAGSRDHAHAIPANLAPGPLAERLAVRVQRVESLPDAVTDRLRFLGQEYDVRHWREDIEVGGEVLARFVDDLPAISINQNWCYSALWPTLELVQSLVDHLMGKQHARLPVGLRRRRRGDLSFWMHRGEQTIEVPGAAGHLCLGSRRLTRGDVSVVQN